MEQVQAVGGTAAVLRLDISDVSSFASFTSELSEQLERWGASRLDILVNNAGVGIFGSLEDVTIDDFDTVRATNVRGTFFLIQSLVPLLTEARRVINVSSSLTRHISPVTAVYSASKAAVEVLSRTLALELGPRSIRVNSIAPGPTATDFNGGAMRDDARCERTGGTDRTGRVGEPDEIGDAIATLASDGLRWVTAQRIEVPVAPSSSGRAGYGPGWRPGSRQGRAGRRIPTPIRSRPPARGVRPHRPHPPPPPANDSSPPSNIPAGQAPPVPVHRGGRRNPRPAPPRTRTRPRLQEGLRRAAHRNGPRSRRHRPRTARRATGAAPGWRLGPQPGPQHRDLPHRRRHRRRPHRQRPPRDGPGAEGTPEATAGHHQGWIPRATRPTRG